MKQKINIKYMVDTGNYAGEVSKEFLNKFDALYYWVFV